MISAANCRITPSRFLIIIVDLYKMSRGNFFLAVNEALRLKSTHRNTSKGIAPILLGFPITI